MPQPGLTCPQCRAPYSWRALALQFRWYLICPRCGAKLMLTPESARRVGYAQGRSGGILIGGTLMALVFVFGFENFLSWPVLGYLLLACLLLGYALNKILTYRMGELELYDRTKQWREAWSLAPGMSRRDRLIVQIAIGALMVVGLLALMWQFLPDLFRVALGLAMPVLLAPVFWYMGARMSKVRRILCLAGLLGSAVTTALILAWESPPLWIHPLLAVADLIFSVLFLVTGWSIFTGGFGDVFKGKRPAG